MKKLFFLLFSVSFMIPLNSQKTSTGDLKSQRIEKIINSDWTFNYFPEEQAVEEYQVPGYDDSRWPAVSLPHTWMTYETTGDIQPFFKNTPESENPYWWTGWGWYRKRFQISEPLKDRKIFVEFAGVQKYCKVWINGKYLGDHKGGYGSFDFDLTGFVNEGKENVIVVAVSNRQKDPFRIPPMTAGSFRVYGGIYRNVTIVVKNKLYIPMQGSAAHEGGTFLSTPQVSEKEGIVRIQTWVKNDYSQPRLCVLNSSIFDATNRIVQVLSSTSTIGPGQLFMFDQTSKPVRNPRLWSFENPYLYRVQSEVVDGKTIVDTYSSPLGFRWFRWDCTENCLYLNNKKAAIQSSTYFEEYPWLGAAVPAWIVQMDFQSIKESQKFNLIRTGYYPGQKLVYDLADKYGLVVAEETPGINNKEFSPEVQDQLLKEMIRRDRNHPSVLFWGFGNESSYISDSKLVMNEDQSRILVSRRVPDYSATDYVTFTEDSKSCDIVFNETPAVMKPLPDFTGSDRKSPAVQSVKTGEPARILLTGSNQKISAGRSSIVIVAARIIDSNGNVVRDPDKAFKWSVTGPGKLIAPSRIEPGNERIQLISGAGQESLPVINIIRATGQPGKIRVTLSASGLASGILEIEAEEVKPDNTAISEPGLSDEGRKSVSRALIIFERLEDVPKEIKLAGNDLNTGASDRQGYARIIKEYLIKNNPSVDTTSTEFRTLVSLFASHLLNNNGHLTAEDFNFNAGHFNNCRLISRYINATRLPPLFKECLKGYYADVVISRGIEKNAGDEMNWMNWIPSGGTVVVSQDGSNVSWPKETIITGRNDLTDLIAAVYPAFLKYSEEAKERALTFISKMNPYVKVNTVTEQSKEGGQTKVIKVTYTVERDKPILIPLIKFIAE